MTEIERLLSEQLRSLEAQRSREIADLRALLNEQMQRFQALETHVRNTLQECVNTSQESAQAAHRAEKTALQVQQAGTQQMTILCDHLSLYNEKQSALNDKLNTLAEVLRR